MLDWYGILKSELKAERLCAVATVIAGKSLGNKMLLWPEGRTDGDLGGPEVNAAVQAGARDLFDSRRSDRLRLELEGQPIEVFVDVQVPPPRLIVVGAVHIAIPLVNLAKVLGFRTVVLDPRAVFATRERFPNADEVVVSWPEEAFAAHPLTAACSVVVLSHDLKVDTPALQLALQSPARYVGAIGSRKTQKKRADALREMGVSDGEIARIRSPIGLNLGGRQPEEIALSILAEVVSVANGIQSAQAGPLTRP